MTSGDAPAFASPGLRPQHDGVPHSNRGLARQADGSAHAAGRIGRERQQSIDMIEMDGLRTGEPLQRGVDDARTQRARRAHEPGNVQSDGYI